MAQANEEQEFLKEQIESLIADRTTQQQKFQELVRQNHSLAAELNILRAHLAGQETVESPSTSSTDFAVMKLDFHQSETFGVAPLLTLRREHRVSPGASQSEFSGNSELPNLPNQTMTNQQHDQGNTTGSPSSHDQWGKHSFMRSAENTLTSEHETESTNSITQKP